MRFPGFTRVYDDGNDEDETPRKAARTGCRNCDEGEPLECRKLEPKQHFTEPPPRYTEAALVKALEDNGIGRPSTYSTIVETIQARGYVNAAGAAVHADARSARRSTTCWSSTFRTSSIWTSPPAWRAISTRSPRGTRTGSALLRRFYGPFESELEEAEQKLPRLELRDEPTDEICPELRPSDGDQERAASESSYRAPAIPSARRRNRSSRTRAPIVPRTAARSSSGARRRAARSTAARNYPNCDFVSWDRVIPQRCPVCGSHVVSKMRRGGDVTCSAPPIASTTSAHSQRRAGEEATAAASS